MATEKAKPGPKPGAKRAASSAKPGPKPGSKHKDNQGVKNAVSLKLSDSEAALRAIIAADHTDREIYVAGLQAIAVRGVLPMEALGRLKQP